MPSRSAKFLISTVYTCMSENYGLNGALLGLDSWQVILSYYEDSLLKNAPILAFLA